MTLTPKHIIFIAVSNYLSATQCNELKNEFIKYKRLSGAKFIQIIEKYFDFKTLRDKALIPEDIWLFNYLMYDTNKKGIQKLGEVGEKITATKGFKKTPLIRKYETKIILPQLKALQEANMIITNLYY